MTLTAEMKADLTALSIRMKADIEALERKLSVSCIDDQPFVVVTGGTVVTALKRLTPDSFNMAATGLDATTYSRNKAQQIANHYGYFIKPKIQFYQEALATKRSVFVDLNEALAKA